MFCLPLSFSSSSGTVYTCSTIPDQNVKSILCYQLFLKCFSNISVTIYSSDFLQKMISRSYNSRICERYSSPTSLPPLSVPTDISASPLLFLLVPLSLYKQGLQVIFYTPEIKMIFLLLMHLNRLCSSTIDHNTISQNP